MGKADFLTKSHAGAVAARARAAGLLTDIGQERHEARPLDGVLDGSLEGGAVAAALAAEELALAGAEFLESRHVFVIDERGPGAAFLGAEAAAVLTAASELFPNHRSPRLRLDGVSRQS